MIRRKTDPTMKRVHLHSPVTIKLNEKIDYSISQDGMVTIRVEGPVMSEEYDEITVPAYHIFKISKMLNETRIGIKNVPRNKEKS